MDGVTFGTLDKKNPVLYTAAPYLFLQTEKDIVSAFANKLFFKRVSARPSVGSIDKANTRTLNATLFIIRRFFKWRLQFFSRHFLPSCC
jgi:hypothetical protein